MYSFSKADVSSCLTPRQILSGDGAAEKIGELLDGWQVPKGNVLLVADSQVVQLGLHRAVAAALEGAGYPALRFDAIVGEPTLETAVALVAFARRQPCGAVIGLGGGSAMDMSKLASAMAVNTGEVRDYLGITRFAIQPLPLILVPTTAGTGAEATAVSMLSVEGCKTIVLTPQLVPMAAVLDPLLTVSLPPKVTAATGLDALSHALEGYISVKANAYTDTQAIATMTIVARWLKTAYKDGANLQARRAMSHAAFTGGLCLNAGVVMGHSVAYTIANRTGTPHGVSCAMALPYTVAFNLPAVAERLQAAAAQVLTRPGASAADLALWVRDLNRELGLPLGLKEVGLGEKDIESMVEECLTKYPRPTNPVPLDPIKLRIFYRHLLDADVEGCIESFQDA